MGRGWRKAFCATIPYTTKLQTHDHQFINTDDNNNNNNDNSPSLKSCAKLGFLSSNSNPSTPRLRVRTSISDHTKSTSNSNSPRLKLSSNPSSPRSPFAILKNSLRLSKSGCPLCLRSLKSGGSRIPVYTAQCSHSFHFPCISSHVRSQSSLVCPVCNVAWKHVPLLPLDSASSAPATPTGMNRNKRIVSKLSVCYNDDEPLPSPRFNGIPEEDGDEFQGFCVTPKLPKQFNHSTPRPLSVDVKLLPEAAVVSGSRSYQTYAVALRVKAPPSTDSPTHRAPIDLVTVLDVSGSMTGSKLQMLKRAMRLVISSLGSADRLSIIAFASTPERLLSLRRMTPQGQKTARKIIDQLGCGQGSSVSDALRKAAKVLEDRKYKNPVCSIILLSDGQHDYTHSTADNHQRVPTATRFAHIEIPVNPSGFGGFKTSDLQHDAFAKCVGGLLSVVVQDLRVQLGFTSSSIEIMAVYSCNGRPSLMSSDSARLGDLYAEEERDVLVELKVPISSIRAHHVMCVRCSYKDPVTTEVIYARERALLVPTPHAIRSSEPRIERLRNLFIYTRAVAESRRLVDHGDYSSAHHLVSSARTLVAQSSSAEEYAKGLEIELAYIHYKRQYQLENQNHDYYNNNNNNNQNSESLTPKSSWGAAEKLAKVAMIKNSLNRSVSELHGFENARF